MSTFSNIIYISRGLNDEQQALAQALAVAEEHGAGLTILIVHPPLPESLEQYRAVWEDGLAAAARASLAALSPGRSNEVHISVDSPEIPADGIVRRVLRQGFDLVIKQAETISQGRGHRAVDMELLRKCPCPVWLVRPREDRVHEPRVAVAIDPDSQEPAAVDLAVRLLKTASALSGAGNGKLQIVSCWDCEYEGYLRHHPFARIPNEKVDQTVIDFEKSNSRLLVDLVRKSAIIDYDLNHVRGKPEEVIPAFVKKHGIDILVMGTVARSGIPGFIMGNTAENIVQKLSCTLVALKPPGFVSPVKAY